MEEENKTNIQEEKKAVEKTPEKKPEEIKKDKAIVNGKNLSVSKKHSMAICDFIRGKKIEEAIRELEKVRDKKKALKMKGEIPHKQGISGARYPFNASKIFIMLLKSLNSNCSVAGLENPYISFAKANQASRPYKRFGSRKMKRSHIYLEARESKIKEEKKTKKK